MRNTPKHIPYYMAFFLGILILSSIMASYFCEQNKSVAREDEKEKNMDSAVILLDAISADVEAEDSTKTFPRGMEESPTSDEKRYSPSQTEDIQENEQVYFENLKKMYLQELIEDIPPGWSRTDIVIRYYKRTGDNDNGIFELKELKYYIHERDVDSKSAYFPNNFISYGDNIRKEDIQIIAYTLLKNGIPIKAIKSFKYSSGWKVNSIEIGNDASLNEESVLTLSDIRKIE